jgi:hypothetical protein
VWRVRLSVSIFCAAGDSASGKFTDERIRLPDVREYISRQRSTDEAHSIDAGKFGSGPKQEQVKKGERHER